jgi:ribosome-associated heat shock protein Hsp15
VDAAERTRIDKWLWAARFFKTRSLAAQAVELGRVRVGGARVKPARELHGGELLEIQLAEARIDIVVRALSTMRGPAPMARQLYEETAESIARRERRAEQRRAGSEPAEALRGRPTKRDGRNMRRVLHGD